ncbi:MAG: hypothetical protein LWW77_06035 [Propionibacteriales bacterium]|nr:hypothetical protein [Propionibacteriales bacterium]
MRGDSVATGVGVVALALMLGGCAVTPPYGPSTVAPARSGSATSASSPSPTVATPSSAVLGPGGYSGLTLGMTKSQAMATGLASGISGNNGTCGADGDGRLNGAIPADASDLEGKLFFSTTTGKLVIIGAMSGVATPEGVHLGSLVKEVKKAYPKWKGSEGDEGLGFVKVPGNPAALYRLYIDAGQVLELTLQTVDQDCAE